MKIELCSQDQIENYYITACRFFTDVLGTDYNACLVTDESRLSDFSSCGLPEKYQNESMSLREVYDAWDKWIIPEITARYKIELESTRITLVSLFEKIEAATNQQTH